MKSPVVSVGLLLTIACLALYVFEPDLITATSHFAYDTLLENHHDAPKSDDVVIVDVDEASLDAHGQWPWPRWELADLTQRILDAGASVVAFDVVFPEPDRKSPAVASDELRERFDVDWRTETVPAELRDFDQLFARTLEGGPTILGCYMLEASEGEGIREPAPEEDAAYRGLFYTIGPGEGTEFLPQSRGITTSIAPLSEAVANNAFFNTKPDFDGLVRLSPLVWARGSKRMYPSLALEATRMHLGVDRIGIEYEEEGITALRLNDRIIPTDPRGRVLVNYRARTDEESRRVPFPTVSAADVLSGDPEATGLIKGKVVLVGTSAAGLHDLRATPLASEVPGVQIHATIIENILSRDFLISPRWMKGFDVTAIIFMGVFLTFLIHKQRSWLSFLVVIGMVLLLVVASGQIFARWHYVFIPTRLITSMAIIYPVLTALSYWRQERQTRWTRNTFGAMVSKKVLTYLEENPGEALSGRKTEATVFFSDVRGFTSVAEALAPDQLSDLLNRYLSPMTQIIIRRDGYVDKFVGDMIMAVWGVPYSIPNHAAEGCLAALEQMEELRRLHAHLKEQFGHEIHVRMGMNTGLVTAGRMGTDQRWQYTVMGDTVNQASRFEPLNKVYGTDIIIGETTYLQAREAVEARLLDQVVVTGKSQPVRIYELLARKGELPEERLALVSGYETALRLLWDGKEEEAGDVLREVLRSAPNDGPSARLMERISSGMAGPLPPQQVQRLSVAPGAEILP